MQSFRIKQSYNKRFYIFTNNGMRSEYLCRDGVVRRSCNELGGQDGWYDSFEAAQTTLNQYNNRLQNNPESVKLNTVEEVIVKKNYTVSLNLTIKQAIEVMHCIGKSKTGITYSVYSQLNDILNGDILFGDIGAIEKKEKEFLERNR